MNGHFVMGTLSQTEGVIQLIALPTGAYMQ